MGKFVIEYNPIGLITITKSDKPDKAINLRSKSDQQVIVEILNHDEIERLYARRRLEVNDDEPRATSIRELWKDAGSSLVRFEWDKLGITLGKRIAELVVGLIALFIYLNIFVDPASFGPLGVCGRTPESWLDVFLYVASDSWMWFVFSPYTIMSWFIGWVILALIRKIRTDYEEKGLPWVPR